MTTSKIGLCQSFEFGSDSVDHHGRFGLWVATEKSFPAMESIVPRVFDVLPNSNLETTYTNESGKPF